MGPRAPGVYQLSRVTQARVQGPVVDQLPQATWALVGHTVVSSRCPGRLVLVSEGPRVRPAVPGSLGPFPRARVVDQLSWEPRDPAGWPAVSTSLPGCLRPVPEGLRCPPAVPGDSDHARGPAGSTVVGDSGPGPKSNGFHQLSRVTKDWIRRPSVSTCCLGHSGPGPRARGIGQLSRANRARVRVPAGSTRLDGRLGPRPEGPWG